MKQTCPACNKQFDSSKRKTTFCSNTCRIKYKDPSKRKVFACQWCGKEFEDWAYRNTSYCSNQCRSEYGARQLKPNARKPETMKVDKTCEICGNHFTTNIYQITLRGGGKYCSVKCKYEGASRDMIKSGGPNYKGGISHDDKYFRGANWGRQRLLTLKRDSYTCQVCHKRRSVFLKVDVHHIKPYRFFNGDFDSANQLSNLITLCRSDHARVECGTIPCPKPKE